MSDPEFVTPAHLDAVRGEVHALIGQHKAETAGQFVELKGMYVALDGKLDASRSAQERDSLGTRVAIEQLTTEVRGVTEKVGRIETGDAKAEAVNSALDAFTNKWGRRLLAGATLLVMILGVLVAAFH